MRIWVLSCTDDTKVFRESRAFPKGGLDCLGLVRDINIRGSHIPPSREALSIRAVAISVWAQELSFPLLATLPRHRSIFQRDTKGYGEAQRCLLTFSPHQIRIS